MVIVSAIGGAYYLFNNNIFLGLSLFAIGAASPVISAASLYRPFLVGTRDFKRAALYGLGQGAVPTLAVLAALLLKAPLFVLVLAYFATNAVTVWFLFERTARLAKNKEIDEITDHLGKHLSVIGLFSTIGGKLDSILIFQFLGGTELAIFSLATTLPDTIRGSLKHIGSLATPKFATMSKVEMKRAIWSKMKIIFLATLAIVLAYVSLAPYLFSWLFPLYQESVIYSQVYAFSLLISLILASAYWDAQAAVKERYILNITVNVATVASSLVGVIFFGIWGAILARIFAKTVSIGLTMYLINRH
jgi:O-antigen/teichoic acid export membrane protein